jgi:Tfp pilus assembly protein FimT
MHNSKRRGFTIIEGMGTLAIVSLLVATSLPSVGTMMERSTLQNAADTLTRDLHFARAEAITNDSANGVNLSFSSDGGNDWCYGLTTAHSCDCTVTSISDADACVLPSAGNNQLRVVHSADYNFQVKMPAVSFTDSTAHFTSTRHPERAGKVSLSAAQHQIDVALTPMGRIRVCSSADQDYTAC